MEVPGRCNIAGRRVICLEAETAGTREKHNLIFDRLLYVGELFIAMEFSELAEDADEHRALLFSVVSLVSTVFQVPELHNFIS